LRLFRMANSSILVVILVVIFTVASAGKLLRLGSETVGIVGWFYSRFFIEHPFFARKKAE
ncbi:MAG: hypothetical protein PHD65_08785, partial [Gallionella sp.]|nr:hypothetical protein [Gallionella sp.]